MRYNLCAYLMLFTQFADYSRTQRISYHVFVLYTYQIYIDEYDS